MRKIWHISIHCSATPTGSALIYDHYHKEHNGWKNGIGYHFIISNGNNGDGYFKSLDGQIESGRSIRKEPAAVRGHNRGMIAICLTGSNYSDFTKKQFKSLKKLLKELIKKYNIKLDNIKGHRDYLKKKTKRCPCFDVKSFLSGKQMKGIVWD